ncbi:MAG: hypothetical protein KF775_04485 [Cyclobacteriaceae bacterium]|nr:hypothetical protein [Cyclobacteriaceae bacterium]
MGNFRTLLSTLLILGSLVIRAQPELPKIVPLAPNAAALTKYGDIPVSQYNGTANFSIPLWTIKSKDITVPISLNYHSGGIRLKEYAGWVGLGWTLDAGGVITRQLKGKDDLNNSNWLDFKTQGQSSVNTGQVQARTSTFKFQPGSPNTPTPYIINTTKNEQFDLTSTLQSIEGYDTEYDIFSYNFMGHTGKFLRTRNGNVVKLEKKSDLIITFPDGTDQFKIKDTAGNLYYFNSYEIASLNPQEGIYITAWYLSKIVSPLGNEITFNYISTGLPVLPNENQTIVVGGLSPYSGSTITSATYNQAWLISSIVFDGGHVEFVNDDARPDYTGKRITGVKVFQFNSALPISEHVFTYSSFDSQRMRLDAVAQKAGMQLLPPYKFAYNTYSGSGNKSLTSYDFDHWGFFNGKSNSVLIPKFQYGPVKVSPTDNSPPLQYTFWNLSGADRNPSSEAMKLFSLKEIQYPTGGKTVIETEANTFEYDLNEVSREVLPETIRKDTLLYFHAASQAGNYNWVNSRSDISVVVSFVCTGNIIDPTCITSYRNNPSYPYGSIYFQIGGVTRDLAGDFVTCGGPQCQATFTLPPNTVLNFNSSIASGAVGNVTITVRLTYFETLYSHKLKSNSRVLTGGGLRVKKITEYDVNGNFLKSKRFEYHYLKDTNGDNVLEEHSFGKRMTPPIYWRYNFDKEWAGGSIFPTISLHRYTSPIAPSIHIAYSKVIEYNQNDTGNDLGKTEYVFANLQDSIYQFGLTAFPGSGYHEMPVGATNLSYKINGSLKLKKEYALVNSVYQPVREVRNDYSVHVMNNYFGVKYQLVPWEGTIMGVTSIIYHLYVYPAMREERIRQVSSLEKTFDINDSTKINSITTSLVFGNNHELPLQKSSINAFGRTEILLTIYPPDYGILSATTYGVKSLKDLNILTPIEQYSIVNGNVTSGTISTYKETSPLLDKVYQLETSVPIVSASFNQSNKVNNTISLDSRYKERISYKQYDTEGNPIELAKTDDGNISYLWGYEKRYPIAEVKNASFNQVAYTSFESTVNEGNWAFAGSPTNVIGAKTGKFVYALSPSNTLGQGLAPGKYYLEYYAKAPITIAAAVAPVIVDVTTSLPDANGWIYYKKEVTITGSTALTLSTGGTTVYVDEVKIYPVQALMTTYVHDPLIGITHRVDPNGKINYYEYDSFNRLRFVRDSEGNMVKQTVYRYGNE